MKRISLLLVLTLLLSCCPWGVPGQEQAVAIESPALEQAIREAIGKPEGALYSADLLLVTNLTPSSAVDSLTGIEFCINLEALNCWGNTLKDLTPLAGLERVGIGE